MNFFLKVFLFYGLFLSGLGIYACVDHNKSTDKPPTVVTQDTCEEVTWFCSSIETWPEKDTKASRAVGAKGKFWPVGSILKIGFIGGTTVQQSQVKTYAEEWTTYANVKFTYPTVGPYDIRIAFQNSGAWSYVGTDAKQLPQNYPTMNFGFMGADVVKHEFGHMLGLYHEHQNPQSGICWDEAQVIKELSGPPNNWSVAQIRFNVLDKHNPNNVITTVWDNQSIMHYGIPASWTCNKVGITGGKQISTVDRNFIAVQYPGSIPPPVPGTITLTEKQVSDILLWLNASVSEADSNAVHLKLTRDKIKKTLVK